MNEREIWQLAIDAAQMECEFLADELELDSEKCAVARACGIRIRDCLRDMAAEDILMKWHERHDRSQQ